VLVWLTTDPHTHVGWCGCLFFSSTTLLGTNPPTRTHKTPQGTRLSLLSWRDTVSVERWQRPTHRLFHDSQYLGNERRRCLGPTIIPEKEEKDTPEERALQAGTASQAKEWTGPSVMCLLSSSVSPCCWESTWLVPLLLWCVSFSRASRSPRRMAHLVALTRVWWYVIQGGSGHHTLYPKPNPTIVLPAHHPSGDLAANATRSWGRPGRTDSSVTSVLVFSLCLSVPAPDQDSRTLSLPFVLSCAQSLVSTRRSS
jgi:hypothetical protein